jgi:hypothetical protein
VQQVVPVPHAGQGQVVHDGDEKKLVQVPCAQTWSAAHAGPHRPATDEQWTGLDASCADVQQPPPQKVRPTAMHVTPVAHRPSMHRWLPAQA